MRRRVAHSGEESPPAPFIPAWGLLQRGEKFPDVLNPASPPLKKGGQGGFDNADIPTNAHHAP
jgi:hypothetical protein